MVAAEYTDASGRAIGAIERHVNAAAATPTTAAHNTAAVASAPRRPANGFFHLSIGPGGFGAANDDASCAASCSPRNPLRIRSAVNGNSRKRTPVAPKIALPIPPPLGTDTHPPPPTPAS